MKRLILAALAAFALAAPASAGNGSIAPQQTDLAYGDSVTFSVSTNANPYTIHVRCYQGTYFVYDDIQLIGPQSGVFVLANPGPYEHSWNGGAANCVAELGRYLPSGRLRVDASVAFDVTA